jgi:hypothetical protein
MEARHRVWTAYSIGGIGDVSVERRNFARPIEVDLLYADDGRILHAEVRLRFRIRRGGRRRCQTQKKS